MHMGCFVKENTAVFVKLQRLQNLYKYKHIARQKGGGAYTQKLYLSQSEYSRYSQKLLKQQNSFLSHHHQQKKNQTKKQHTIITKNKNNPPFFSFFLFSTLSTKVCHLPFFLFSFSSSPFLFFLSCFSISLSPSLSLSCISLSLYLSFFLHLFYTKYTQINIEYSGPKLTISIMFLFNLIILQNNLVLVN